LFGIRMPVPRSRWPGVMLSVQPWPPGEGRFREQAVGGAFQSFTPSASLGIVWLPCERAPVGHAGPLVAG
jgi:hypothetical protein